MFKPVEMCNDLKMSSEELYAKYGRDNVSFIVNPKTSTYGVMINSTDSIFIVFNGTQVGELKDWKTDFSFNKYPYGNTNTKIEVHRGFYLAYCSVRPSIHSTIKRWLSTDKIIYCIGHSLGGALATLCSVDVQYNFNDWPRVLDTVLISFGAPKVFNKEGVESFKKRVTEVMRFTNRYDIVPLLPPVGYYHVSNPVKIGHNPFNDPPFNHDLEKSYIKYLK
jgi:predicted lipase